MQNLRPSVLVYIDHTILFLPWTALHITDDEFDLTRDDLIDHFYLSCEKRPHWSQHWAPIDFFGLCSRSRKKANKTEI